MLKEMNLEPGDTVMLVDTGYIGVTQTYLARTFEKDLNIEITSRYVLGSDEPDKPKSKALITTTWCDHGLFEQSCTYQEGAVSDYDEEGNPSFEAQKLSNTQYDTVRAIQAECLRFIQDAKELFSSQNSAPDFAVLQAAAHAALKRQIFLPLEEELAYFQHFQLDKDMGPDSKRTIYNIPQALNTVKKSQPPYFLNPYEARALSPDVALSALLQRGLQLDLTAEDLNVRYIPVKAFFSDGQANQVFVQKALYTQDGYYALTLPCVDRIVVGLIFGEHYHWIQLEEIALMHHTQVLARDLQKELIFDQIACHDNLLECQSSGSVMLIKPPVCPGSQNMDYRIVFRPLKLR